MIEDTTKQENAMLNDKTKAEIMKDFQEWSGGYEPSEMTTQDIQDYIDYGMGNSGWDIQDTTEFLMHRMSQPTGWPTNSAIFPFVQTTHKTRVVGGVTYYPYDTTKTRVKSWVAIKDHQYQGIVHSITK